MMQGASCKGDYYVAGDDYGEMCDGGDGHNVAPWPCFFSYERLSDAELRHRVQVAEREVSRLEKAAAQYDEAVAESESLTKRLALAKKNRDSRARALSDEIVWRESELRRLEADITTAEECLLTASTSTVCDTNAASDGVDSEHTSATLVGPADDLTTVGGLGLSLGKALRAARFTAGEHTETRNSLKSPLQAKQLRATVNTSSTLGWPSRIEELAGFHWAVAELEAAHGTQPESADACHALIAAGKVDGLAEPRCCSNDGDVSIPRHRNSAHDVMSRSGDEGTQESLTRQDSGDDLSHEVSQEVLESGACEEAFRAAELAAELAESYDSRHTANPVEVRISVATQLLALAKERRDRTGQAHEHLLSLLAAISCEQELRDAVLETQQNLVKASQALLPILQTKKGKSMSKPNSKHNEIIRKESLRSHASSKSDIKSDDDLQESTSPRRNQHVDYVGMIASLKMVMCEVQILRAAALKEPDFWPAYLRRLEHTISSKRTDSEELRAAYALIQEQRMNEKAAAFKQRSSAVKSEQRLRDLLERAFATGHAILEALEPLADWTHQMESALTEIAFSKDGCAADRLATKPPLEAVTFPDKFKIDQMSGLLKSLAVSRMPVATSIHK